MRYSLRTLLIAITLACVCLGWLAYVARNASEEAKMAIGVVIGIYGLMFGIVAIPAAIFAPLLAFVLPRANADWMKYYFVRSLFVASAHGCCLVAIPGVAGLIPAWGSANIDKELMTVWAVMFYALPITLTAVAIIWFKTKPDKLA